MHLVSVGPVACDIAPYQTKLLYEITFYYFSCTAHQTNALNVFISNTLDIIQLSTSNMVARDSDNIHITIWERLNSAATRWHPWPYY